MKRHALSRFRTNTREGAQSVNKLGEARRVLHQRGRAFPRAATASVKSVIRMTSSEWYRQNGSLERQLESRRQLHSRGDGGHLLGNLRLDLMDRVVDGCGDEVFQHLSVFARNRSFDLHALDLMLARH